MPFHHRPLQDYRVQPQLALSILVALADRMAAGFERKARDSEQEAAWRDSGPARERFRRTPIEAMTTNIRLGERGARRGHHLPQELTPDAILPAAEVRGEDVEKGYSALWDGFKTAWNEAARRCAADPVAFEEAVLSLSERFLWSVPSSTVDQPDVSLHDHSHAVAAFASALFRFHQSRRKLSDPSALADREVPAFRFVVGDLSGLQSTLFRLQSEGVKGLNKTLRGRSLRFQLIADACVRETLRAFDMPMSAALQTAGGRFLVLVPNLDEADKILKGMRARFDSWFVDQYSGDLALGLALSDPFVCDDLVSGPSDDSTGAERIGKVRGGIGVAAEIAKLQLLAGQAAHGVVDATFSAEGACGTCGVRPAGKEGLCAACAGEAALGDRLPRSRAVVISDRGGLGEMSAKLLSHDYLLPSGEGETRHDRGTGWRWMLDPAPHRPAPLRPGPAWVARFGDDIGPYADLEDVEAGHIKTFQALARDSREIVNGKPIGREMLALLKGDVDRLGRIFAGGLSDRWSVARSAALSRMMDAYFTLRLPHLLRTDFPDSYTVYAGGDDFMLVLPWRQGFELARTLRRDFERFAGGNPDLTFSLGIALFDPRTPISIPAREAENRLEAAKSAGRNRVSALEDTPLTWEAFSEALDRAETLNRWLREGRLSTAFLYRVLAIDDARRRVAAGHARPSDYAWMARLGYQIARNLKKRDDAPIRTGILELFGLDERWQGEALDQVGARLAISHAIYRNR
ncbi:type III-A CRISPR-associated protein Cas10/Csm1 [Jhaorihella thermophila]|uniref:type III-A CRISPR-associated protein Cas10/Csm1 n=1 Tax=Jhaorihella thermophila TaxID=488547 RepID=UPI003A93E2FD